MRFIVLLMGCILGVSAIALGATAQDAPVAPEVREFGLSQPGPLEAVPGQIVVKLRANAPAAEVARLHAAHGAVELKAQPRSGLHRLQLPPQANVDQVIAAYERTPFVEDAGRLHIVQLFEAPNDPNYPYQWHLADTDGGVHAESAWGLSPTAGAGVVVAVIDTGVAFEAHSRDYGGFFGVKNFAPAPDLDGKTFVAPWNFVHNDAHPTDDHGHGTHVTGTIAQDTNDNYGVAGVAHGASIMPLKVLDVNGQGSADDLVEAILYAADNGADVINMSLGFSGTGAPDANGEVCTGIVGLNDALDTAVAAGVVIVAASGNEGAANVSCPAAHPSVISVGATGTAGTHMSYSNTGAALDVAAPGGNPDRGIDENGDGFSDAVIQETYCNPGSWILLIGHFTSFCDVFMAGTSMASPHVAGIAALLLGEDASLTPGEVRDVLMTTARDRGAAGWDAVYGAGLVDARAAVATITGDDPDPTDTPTNTPISADTPTTEPTATFTPSGDPPTPTATPCPQGWIKRGLCSGGGGAPTATFTPTPTSDPGNPTATPTPSSCPPGRQRKGEC